MKFSHWISILMSIHYFTSAQDIKISFSTRLFLWEKTNQHVFQLLTVTTCWLVHQTTRKDVSYHFDVF